MDITLTEKQTLMFNTTANEVFGGGSASGGKTFLNKVLAMTIAEQVPGAQIAILRNTSKNLKKNYFMGAMSMPAILREHIKAGLVKINYTDLVITWESGSAIHFMHAEHVESTIENLTGLEFVCIIGDECSLLDSKIINHAKSRLRIGSLKIENQFWKDRLPRLQLTSNPSGISHTYLKQTYIDPATPGKEFIDANGVRKLFIPFGARENPHVDYEAYERQLRSMGDPVKYKQLALGDWDAAGNTLMGYAFNRDYNVCKPFTKDQLKWFRISRHFDYGWSSPSACIWLGELEDTREFEMSNGATKSFPRGTKVIVKEWVTCKHDAPDEGLKLSERELAEGILGKEEIWCIKGRVQIGCGDVYDRKSGDGSIGDEMAKFGVKFKRPWKSSSSRSVGWSRMCDLMLQAHATVVEKPALLFTEDCLHCIATIPDLPVDPNKPDDCITTGVNDHCADACRYGISSKVNTIGTIQVTGI
jgi:hypothetical protein